MNETHAQDLQQAYADTVRGVIDSVPDVMDGEWGDRISDISFAVARTPDGPLELVDFRLSRAVKTGFERISALAFDRDGRRFTTCDLVIEADGTYRFDFAHDAPYRLGGHVHDTRFDDYLARHRAETGEG